MTKNKLMFLKNISGQIILGFAVLSGWLLPYECCAATDSFEKNNNKKIKALNHAVRTALQEKKLDITPEDAFKYVPKNIQVSKLVSLEIEPAREKQMREQFLQEAQKLYPVYIMGDIIRISGKTEHVTGRYNKKNNSGFWVGMRMIPWSNLSPECRAQFSYKEVVKLRNAYVEEKINRIKYADFIKVDDKWIAPRQYTEDLVKSCKTQMAEKVPDYEIYKWLGAAAGFILFGIIGACSPSKSGSAKFFKGLFGAIIGVLIGFFAASFFSVRSRNLKIDLAVKEVVAGIVDPDSGETDASAKNDDAATKKDDAAAKKDNAPAKKDGTAAKKEFRFFKIEERPGSLLKIRLK